GYLIGSLDNMVSDSTEPARDEAPAETPVVAATPTKRPGDLARQRRRRKSVAKMLADQKLEEHVIEIELEPEDAGWPAMEFTAGLGGDDMSDAFQDFLAHMQSQRKRSRQ